MMEGINEDVLSENKSKQAVNYVENLIYIEEHEHVFDENKAKLVAKYVENLKYIEEHEDLVKKISK